jgi:hypothetical protein
MKNPAFCIKDYHGLIGRNIFLLVDLIAKLKG